MLDPAAVVPAEVAAGTAPIGRRYVVGAADIGRYLAAAHGAGLPHP